MSNLRATGHRAAASVGRAESAFRALCLSMPSW
jgi:hypothetical protein